MFQLLLSAISPSFIPFEISPNHNTSSFIQDILRCLELPSNRTFLPTNTTAAAQHYHAIQNYVLQYQRVTRPAYRDCEGPFLEEEFIRRFSARPLTTFSPFVPLFMPWFALWKDVPFRKYRHIVSKLFDLLRPDYLYVLLSESDFGVSGGQHVRGKVPDNVFVFSPSGMGHVAVPWLQCEFTAPSGGRTFKHFLSFCGNSRASGERKHVLETARAVFRGDFVEYRGSDWKRITAESVFGFAPRGIAVATYRTFELIRLETIPVIATDEVHWLPYFPVLNWSRFSVLTNVQELPRTANRLRSMGSDEIREMRVALHHVSLEFFQWDAFFHRLELFFRGGKSALTCSNERLTDF